MGGGLHGGKYKRYNEKLRQHDMGGGMVKQGESLCHVIEIDDMVSMRGNGGTDDWYLAPIGTIRCRPINYTEKTSERKPQKSRLTTVLANSTTKRKKSSRGRKTGGEGQTRASYVEVCTQDGTPRNRDGSNGGCTEGGRRAEETKRTPYICMCRQFWARSVFSTRGDGEKEEKEIPHTGEIHEQRNRLFAENHLLAERIVIALNNGHG